MAIRQSTSMHMGQCPSVCHLCQSSTKIKSKCLECKLLMCEACRNNIHPKFRKASEHRITEIQDVGSYAEEMYQVDFSDIKCKEHLGQSCCLFCKTCDSLVCPSCIAKVHVNHNFIETNEWYDMKKSSLIEKKEILIEQKKKLIICEESLKEIIQNESLKYAKSKQDIIKQTTLLRQIVEHHANLFEDELENNLQTIKDSVEREKRQVEILKNQLDEKIRSLDDILNTSEADKFIDKADRVKQSTEETQPIINLTFDSVAEFTPGGITKFNFGVLQKEVKLNTSKCRRIQMEIKAIFTTVVPHVTTISFLTENSFWLKSVRPELLQKVVLDSTNIKVLTSINLKVIGMAVNSLGDLIVATENSGRLKQITASSEELTDTSFCVEPAEIRSVHVTRNDTVIVGTRLNLGLNSIVVLNKNGRQQAVYQHDTGENPLFTDPLSIATTSMGNICVMDVASEDYRGRLLVLNRAGDLINIYTGNNDSDIPFKPINMATSPSDNIILLQNNPPRYTLHILHNDGHLMAVCDTVDFGIVSPHSLAFSKDGKCFLGCWSPKGKTAEAKMYEVKLTTEF